MRRTRARSGLAAVALAAALAACSSGGADQGQSPAATQTGDGRPQTIRVQLTASQVQTAERRVEVPLATAIRLEVKADTPGGFEGEQGEAGRKLDGLQPS